MKCTHENITNSKLSFFFFFLPASESVCKWLPYKFNTLNKCMHVYSGMREYINFSLVYTMPLHKHTLSSCAGCKSQI